MKSKELRVALPAVTIAALIGVVEGAHAQKRKPLGPQVILNDFQSGITANAAPKGNRGALVDISPGDGRTIESKKGSVMPHPIRDYDLTATNQKAGAGFFGMPFFGEMKATAPRPGYRSLGTVKSAKSASPSPSSQPPQTIDSVIQGSRIRF